MGPNTLSSNYRNETFLFVKIDVLISLNFQLRLHLQSPFKLYRQLTSLFKQLQMLCQSFIRQTIKHLQIIPFFWANIFALLMCGYVPVSITCR